MSPSPPPKTSALGKSSPSPEATPRQEPRVYHRGPPSGFGDRLASARGLPPSAAPPPPPPRTTVPADGAGFSVLPSGFSPPGGDMASRYAPRIGLVKGSYISPFDSGGKTPGNPRLQASSTTIAEFEAMYGPGSRAVAEDDAQSEGSVNSNGTILHHPAASSALSFGQMSPAAVREKNKDRAAFVAEKIPATLPKGSSPRQLFLGPLQLIRKACADNAGSSEALKLLGEWLQENMPRTFETVLDRDEVIPEVIISVSIPMTQEHWENYNQVLPHFKDALDMHNALTCGSDEFDQVTKAHVEIAGIDTYKRKEPQLTRPLLMDPNLSLEEVLAGMVKREQLGRPWDWGRSTLHPELLPEELGGELKGYPEVV
ncbi:hypothetical protein HBI85_075400 [Parastagonospora nodorum]|nr:hypothetical protein HBI85_075400 [Parastagonospora nodorum]